MGAVYNQSAGCVSYCGFSDLTWSSRLDVENQSSRGHGVQTP